jgi:hypothetical protein
VEHDLVGKSVSTFRIRPSSTTSIRPTRRDARRLATATRDATETLPGIPGWDAPFWVTRFGRNRNEVLSNALRASGRGTAMRGTLELQKR